MSNTIRDESTLKSYFAKGKMPNASNYSDLITSMFGNTSTTPAILPYTASNIPNYADGNYRKCIMTGDMTLYGPTGASYGNIWTCYLTASGTNRNLTFPVSVLIPSDSGFTSPKLLTSNLTYIVQMRYGISLGNTNWVLNSVVGGY